MFYADRLAHHERLMNRMANRNGSDLSLARHVGLLSADEISEAAHECTGCTDATSCETHLETTSPGIPVYCRNSEMLQRLAGEMADLGLTNT